MTLPKSRPALGRRTLLAGAAALSLPAIRATAQTPAAGVALVIGNSKYQWEASLPNVRRDAPDVARRFQALGLKTDLVQDAGRDAMRRAVDAFTTAARGANVAAFYFAGHGAAWGKDTYLVPVDVDLTTPSVVETLIPVPKIQAGMDAAANRLMVFDNCRNNPADGWRQREAQQSAGSRDQDAAALSPNTLILYSTAPGRIALDGPPGENSPFAAALLRELDAASIDLQALPAKLRRELLAASQARQVVFDQNTYRQPFVLRGPGNAAAASRTGWASDPSKIIELPNAYAFAAQNGLPMPAGLIAHRPPPNSPHARKVGAFKFETIQPGGGLVPALVIVLSVEEQDAAELIMVLRVRGQAGWRFIRPAFAGETLDCVPRDNGPRYQFKWNDASGGSQTVFPPENLGRNVPPFTGRFTRLDG
jgi:hypothetical protein